MQRVAHKTHTALQILCAILSSQVLPHFTLFNHLCADAHTEGPERMLSWRLSLFSGNTGTIFENLAWIKYNQDYGGDIWVLWITPLMKLFLFYLYAFPTFSKWNGREPEDRTLLWHSKTSAIVEDLYFSKTDAQSVEEIGPNTSDRRSPYKYIT